MGIQNYLVIGGGVAGMSAATAIRKADGDGRIAVLSAEDEPFYTRIRLPDYVAGRVERSRLVLPAQEWARKNGVERMQGVSATELGIGERRATFSDGRDYHWDRLLLATGAESFMPPLKGIELHGVVALRTVKDADIIRERLCRENCTQVVVMGGGLLGVETAASIREQGVDVCVVESCQWLLSRQIDRDGAAVLMDELKLRGLSFRLDARIDELVSDGDGRVGEVRFSNGEAMPAQMVIVAAGVRPNAELARRSGLNTNYGVVVDDCLRTSAPGVYAAGDCAEHRGQLYGLWSVADAQGRLAGVAMAGGDVDYHGSLVNTTLKVLGMDLLSVGRIQETERDRCEVDTHNGAYRKLLRDDDGRLVGAVLLGDLADRREIVAEVSRNMESHS